MNNIKVRIILGILLLNLSAILIAISFFTIQYVILDFNKFYSNVNLSISSISRKNIELSKGNNYWRTFSQLKYLEFLVWEF